VPSLNIFKLSLMSPLRHRRKYIASTKLEQVLKEEAFRELMNTPGNYWHHSRNKS
jgi:hypothetical protein